MKYQKLITFIFVFIIVVPWLHALVKLPNFDWTKIRHDRPVTENLPFREFALETMSSFLFSTSKVLRPLPVTTIHDNFHLGLDEWGFYYGDFPDQCPTEADIARVKDNLKEIYENLKPSSKKLMLILVPDKTSLFRQFINPVQRDSDCIKGRSSRLAAVFDFLHSTSLHSVDLYSRFNQEIDKGVEPEAIYPKWNTHWSSKSNLTATDAILKSLGHPGIRPSEINTQEDVRMGSDIHVQSLKLDYSTLDRKYSVERSDIKNVLTKESQGGRVRHIKNQSVSPNTLLVPGKTVIIHDSFFGPETAGIVFPKFFEDIVLVHYLALDSKEAAVALRNADLILWESVEREAFARLQEFAQDKGLQSLINAGAHRRHQQSR